MTSRSAGEVLNTIYFGGGTPSMMPPAQIDRLLQAVHRLWRVSNDAEITLEANPEDISNETLKSWKSSGINRLSIGLQSFDDEQLKWMNRTHLASDAVRSVESAAALGFNNISVDLIYGLPGMGELAWEHSIRQAAALPVLHLSAYGLTVEPRTPLHQMIRKKMTPSPDQEVQASQYLLLMELAPSLGFEQYEISNFARGGAYSRHNSAYWNYTPYIGIGPSAHSFDGVVRSHHIPKLSAYIENPLQLEVETLSPKEKFNEYIYISLRKNIGIDLSKLGQLFGSEWCEHVNKVAGLPEISPFLHRTDHGIQLSNEGRVMADRIAMEFFKV